MPTLRKVCRSGTVIEFPIIDRYKSEDRGEVVVVRTGVTTVPARVYIEVGSDSDKYVILNRDPIEELLQWKIKRPFRATTSQGRRGRERMSRSKYKVEKEEGIERDNSPLIIASIPVKMEFG